MCIDETPEALHTKYPNGNIQYTHVGQKSTWEKGFEFTGFYDATHQQFLGVSHHDKYMSDSEKKLMRPWLQTLIHKIEVVHRTGSEVKIIECDRGYFKAEAFAAAYLSLLNPNSPEKSSPRLVIPRKFWNGKDTFKWNYLLDDSIPEVFVDYIHLNPYTHPALKQQCEGVFEKTQNYRYKIPYACVALIDEYSKKSNRTLKEVRKEAKKVESKIHEMKQKLKKAEETYVKYITPFRKEKPSKPGYGKGRRRKNFEDLIDKANYLRCFELHGELQKEKEKKTSLLKSLMFIAISIQEGDDPIKSPMKFTKLAQDYHERWGIERGFEDTKGKFKRDARSRKPTKRLLNLMMGMMLYNNWHVERMRRMLIMYRESTWNKVPWDPSRPWIRRRIEKEFGDCLSADGYLLWLLETGINNEIKKIISKFN